VHTTDSVQILFIDTPGIHRNAGKAMNRLMNRTATGALLEADLVLFVIEANRWTEEDNDVLERIKNSGIPTIALLNKIDNVHPREALLEKLSALAERCAFAGLIPISAKKGDNLDVLLDSIPAFLPESPALFPEEMRTDRSREFHAAEVVREKLTLMLHQELPYGLTVQIERFVDEDDRFTISAIIWVERDSQKGIVVGKGGSRLKQVGTAARVELKRQLGRPVHLELWVKVKQNWADSEKDLHALGFDTPG
jgi:GTP-binding protein Era